MIRKVSDGFWRSASGRFDILKVTEFVTGPSEVIHEGPDHLYEGHVTVPVTRFVVYDGDLGRRLVFEHQAQAVAHVEVSERPTAG